MLGQKVSELLELRSALVVALVRPDGVPFATRGWGLTLFDGGQRAQVACSADDFTDMGYSSGSQIGTTIAITGCNIPTLIATQIKGPITSVRPATPADWDKVERYCEAFFGDIEQIDGFPPYMMRSLVPVDMVVCEFDVLEAYDQSPGPNAGAAFGSRTS